MKYLALLALAGCFDIPDPEWQLDHDRIVAMRATPPHVAPGETSLIDGLVAHKGSPTIVEEPLGAVAAFAPEMLQSAVAADGEVTAPDLATLAAARGQMNLAADATVPLDVAAQFSDQLLAKKTVWLGDSRDNPADVGTVTVNGSAPGDTIEIPRDADVPMVVDPGDPDATVMWLTSCGTLHDDNERSAFVHVQPHDRADGQLVLVVRDAMGGVAWRVWPMHAM